MRGEDEKVVKKSFPAIGPMGEIIYAEYLYILVYKQEAGQTDVII